jgi:predicted dehydrogenase
MIRAILLGAGNRGLGTYGMYALKHPEEIKFIAVADPDQERREAFSKMHEIPFQDQYENAADLLKLPKFADAVFVCTQDRQHTDQVTKALRLGYHIFLEKPMAIKPHDILKIQRQAQLYKRKLVVAHVLRYSPFFTTLKRVLDENHIGDIVAIDHTENVGYYHQAHSYVRGNWKNSDTASPMILAKSCHDMDILSYLIDQKPTHVSSFGELTHFRKESMNNVPNHCMDGCPHQESCLYYAPRVYLNAAGWMKFPVSNDLSDEAILEKLKKGPYGRCVYRSNNNVVDHQTVMMRFESGVTVNFMMTAFTNEITRTVHIMGTKGEIWGNMNDPIIKIKPFGKEMIYVDVPVLEGGHGGGDYGVMKRFINALKYDWDVSHDLDIAVQGHLLAFAAEESRLSQQTIHYQTFMEEIKHGAKKRETAGE